jgi:cytochrome c2
MCEFNRATCDSLMPIPLHSSRLSALLCAALCMTLLAGCGAKEGGTEVVGGDAATGKQLVTQYQCGACHAIPGIRGAGGEAGPSLEGFGKLSYIAGRIPNQPARLAAWLIDPPALKPGTAMPALGLTEQEARHMAAFLYTLQ